MSKFFIFVFCEIFLVFSSLAQSQNEDQLLSTTSHLAGQSIYNLPSIWERQDGVNVLLSSLLGQPVIAAMIYTSCIESCPLIIHNMKLLENTLSKTFHSPIQFALFSIDSEFDTPERLNAFATLHHLNLNHWKLFHGDKKSVQELAAALNVSYRSNKKGRYDHFNIVTLLDKSGVIVTQQNGSRNLQELEEKLKNTDSSNELSVP